MKTKLLVIFLLILTSKAFAEECKGTNIPKFNDCHKTITANNGHKYSGEFKNGKMHGFGEYFYPDGAKYIGEFKNGLKDGQGKFTMPNKAKYVGEFKKGKIHGYGSYLFSSGAKYIGEWKENKEHGKGLMLMYEKEKYIGKFIGEYRNGKSTTGAMIPAGKNTELLVTKDNLDSLKNDMKKLMGDE